MNRRTLPLGALALGLGFWFPGAGAAFAEEVFRLGTFERRGDAFLGVVLRDAFAVELDRANASLERTERLFVRLPMPEDMNEIGRAHV